MCPNQQEPRDISEQMRGALQVMDYKSCVLSNSEPRFISRQMRRVLQVVDYKSFVLSNTGPPTGGLYVMCPKQQGAP